MIIGLTAATPPLIFLYQGPFPPVASSFITSFRYGPPRSASCPTMCWGPARGRRRLEPVTGDASGIPPSLGPGHWLPSRI